MNENTDIKNQLLDNAGIGMFVLNQDFSFCEVNKTFAEFLKTDSPEQLIGRAISQWIAAKNLNQFKQMLAECITKGNIKNRECEFCTMMGEPIFLLLGTSIDPETKKIVGFCQSIKSQKLMENTLRKAKDIAENGDNLKTAFLTNLSHEIRTPMNTIIGFTELLMNNDLQLAQKEKYINYINNSSSTLLKLVDDILDMTKIQSNKLSIKKSKTDINSILYEIYSTYSKVIKANKGNDVELVWNKRDNENRTRLFTDPLRFRQIFTNLLSNAIKFTNKGVIEYGYEVLEDEDCIKFFVKDTGPGLKEYNMDIMFNRFDHTDDNIYLNRGAGLGLTITKSIVSLLGGQIWVETEAGEGTTFYFSFPINLVEIVNSNIISFEQESNDSTDISKWIGKTILVAEDEDINYYYIQELLNRYNVKILHAKNGLEAVQLYQDYRADIDLILMDIKMPIMNGYEATQKIKSMSAKVPIIAQTAFALAGEREKIINAGYDDYLTKPLRPNGLMVVLSKYLN